MRDPIEAGFSITPNDTTNLVKETRAIYVGGAGNLKVETVAGSILVFTSVSAGTVYPLRIRKVFSTGTTASNLLGLY